MFSRCDTIPECETDGWTDRQTSIAKTCFSISDACKNVIAKSGHAKPIVFIVAVFTANDVMQGSGNLRTDSVVICELSKNSQPITGRFAVAFANYLFADSQFADYPKPVMQRETGSVTVSLKHDGTVKMANLPVPSVFDRRTGRLAIFTVPSCFRETP